MSLRIIGAEAVEVAWRNPKRVFLSVQVIPSSVVAGNTGLVYGKWGSAPKADLNSNTWDFVLSQGAVDGTNLYETRDKALLQRNLYLISDTASQQVNVVEMEAEENL